jgi:hypothetical protein
MKYDHTHVHFPSSCKKILIYKENASCSVHIEEKVKDYNLLFHSLCSRKFLTSCQIYSFEATKMSNVSKQQKWDAPKNKSQVTSSSIQGVFKPLSPLPPLNMPL